MRRDLFALLAASLVLAGAFVAAAERPPQDLHLVGDHWTAWNPPTTFPEGAQIYVIERGDTLWDLAARFYQDPYLWPQLWEQNRYVLDAHWIYPGDPLQIGVEVEEVETLADLEPAEEAPLEPIAAESDGGILSAESAAGAPVPLGYESDIYCSGFIGEMEEDFPRRIVGSEHGALLPSMFRTRQASFQGAYGIIDTTKFGLDVGDIVYLDGGRGSGLAPGELFTIVSPRQKVRHPVTDRVVGRLYNYLGRVRVLSVQPDSAIGEITFACLPIPVGSMLRPFEAEPVPLGRNTPLWPINLPAPSSELEDAPVVLHAHGDILSLGQDNIVYIEGGEDRERTPGDVFTVYRLNRPGLPPVVLGELAILSVHERASVAKILKSRHTIYPGDRLSPK